MIETKEQIEKNKEQLEEMPSNSVTDVNSIPSQIAGPLEGDDDGYCTRIS